MAIELPANVTAQRKPISATSYEYIFRHSELGQLGKVLLSVCASGTSRITCLVHGNPGEKLTEQRRAIFEPLAKKLAEQMRLTATFLKGPSEAQAATMA